MKKVLVFIAVTLSVASAMAVSGKASILTGENARVMFFALEKSKATLTVHSQRLTEYSDKGVTCLAEELMDEQGARTGDAEFMCAVEAAK